MTQAHLLAVALALSVVVSQAAHAQQRSDAQGDPLPEGALLRLGTVRFRNPGPVQHTRFALGGKAVIAADRQGVHVWDVASGKHLRAFENDPDGAEQGRSSFHEKEPQSIVISVDGRLLAAGFSSRTRVWEIDTGKELFPFKARNPGGTRAVAFSADGKLLAVSEHMLISVWELATGLQAQQVPTAANVYALAFSPDGKTLAAGGLDGAVRLFDWSQKTEQRVLPASHYKLDFVTFSKDGKALAAAGTYDTCVWEVPTGKELCHVKGYRGTVHSVGLSADGKAILVGGSEAPLVWIDVSTGKEMHRISERTMQLYGLSLSPDGKMFAAGSWRDCVVHVCDAGRGQELRPFSGHVREVWDVAFSPDGRVVASSAIDGVRLWESETGKHLQHISTTPTVHLTFSSNGKLLATSEASRIVRLWDVQTAKELKSIESAPNNSTIAFSPDCSILAVGGINDRAVWLWDIATGREVRRLQPENYNPHENENRSVAFSPDGKKLAARTSTKIRLWEITSAKLLWEVDGRPPNVPYSVDCVAFSPDGQTLAAGLGNGMVVFVESASGRMLRQFPAQKPQHGERGIRALAFSPDGKMLAAANWRCVVLLEAETAQERLRLEVPAGAVAFSPDGRRLASGNTDTTVMIWDVTRP
jgi:WD40 repeat protein